MRGGINVRSYAAAEKDGVGMALKILTRAEDMPDGKSKLESHTYTRGKRPPTFRNRRLSPVDCYAVFVVLSLFLLAAFS